MKYNVYKTEGIWIRLKKDRMENVCQTFVLWKGKPDQVKRSVFKISEQCGMCLKMSSIYYFSIVLKCSDIRGNVFHIFCKCRCLNKIPGYPWLTGLHIMTFTAFECKQVILGVFDEFLSVKQEIICCCYLQYTNIDVTTYLSSLYVSSAWIILDFKIWFIIVFSTSFLTG